MLTKKYSWSTSISRSDNEMEYFDDEGNLEYLDNNFESEQEAIEALDKFLINAGYHWWTCEEFTLNCVYVFSK